MQRDTREQQQLKAKCKHLYEEYSDVLGYIVGEIENEQNSIRVNEDTAFLTAKHHIRAQGLKDGAREVIRKINHYAG